MKAPWRAPTSLGALGSFDEIIFDAVAVNPGNQNRDDAHDRQVVDMPAVGAAGEANYQQPVDGKDRRDYCQPDPEQIPETGSVGRVAGRTGDDDGESSPACQPAGAEIEASSPRSN